MSLSRSRFRYEQVIVRISDSQLLPQGVRLAIVISQVCLSFLPSLRSPLWNASTSTKIQIDDRLAQGKTTWIAINGLNFYTRLPL